MDWELNDHDSDIWFARTTVVSLYRENRRRKILIVRPESHTKWRLPHQWWSNNHIHDPKVAYIRSVQSYVAHVEISNLDDIVVHQCHTCEQDTEIDVTPCSYEWKVESVVRALRKGKMATPSKPEGKTSDSTTSRTITGKQSTDATSLRNLVSSSANSRDLHPRASGWAYMGHLRENLPKDEGPPIGLLASSGTPSHTPHPLTLACQQTPPYTKSAKQQRKSRNERLELHLGNAYRRHMVMCVLYSSEKTNQYEVGMADGTRVKWVPIKSYLKAIGTGVIKVHLASRDGAKEYLKLMGWRMPIEYCEVQFGKSVVEAILQRNPRGQILIVRHELPNGPSGFNLDNGWTLPRHPWYDNGIDTPVGAFKQSVQDYLPQLKLCWNNVEVGPYEVCSRNPHNENGVQQYLTPCSYNLSMDTTYSRVHFDTPQIPEPQPPLPTSTTPHASTSSSTPSARLVKKKSPPVKSSIKTVKKYCDHTVKWGDATNDWSSDGSE